MLIGNRLPIGRNLDEQLLDEDGIGSSVHTNHSFHGMIEKSSSPILTNDASITKTVISNQPKAERKWHGPRQPNSKSKASNNHNDRYRCFIDGCCIDKDESFVRCVMCMKTAHASCANEEGNDIIWSWTCNTCRKMPSGIEKCSNNISSLTSVVQKLSSKLDTTLSKIDSLEQVIRTQASDLQMLQTTNDGLTAQLYSVNTKCEELCKMNSALSKKLHEQPHNKADNKPLLIGNSIIKHIKPAPGSNLTVRCMPGACIDDIKSSLDSTNDKFSSICLVVGSIDVATQQANSDNLMNKYQGLIKKSLEKSENVSISSILPRSDKKDFKKVIDETNKKLKDYCDKITNCHFVNNDGTFKLANGDVNLPLLDDGHHLSDQGSKQLVKNLKLHANITPIQIRYSGATGSKPTNLRGSQYQIRQPNRFNQKSYYRQNSFNRLPTDGTFPSPNNIQTCPSKAPPSCWFCGETGHVASSCRHGDYVQCFSCNGYGHKKNNCSFRNYVDY